MRVTLTFDERNTQERLVLHSPQTVAHRQARRSGSPPAFSRLEQGIGAAFDRIEGVVGRLLCAVERRCAKRR